MKANGPAWFDVAAMAKTNREATETILDEASAHLEDIEKKLRYSAKSQDMHLIAAKALHMRANLLVLAGAISPLTAAVNNIAVAIHERTEYLKEQESNDAN